MSERQEDVERARAAVRAEYGDDDTTSPKTGTTLGSGPAAGNDADAAPVEPLLDRARVLAEGAPEPVRQSSSLWRRALRGVLGRLIRFETAWQHEFNASLVDAAEGLAHRLDTLTRAVERSAGRMNEVVAAQRHLLARLDDETLRRREAEAARDRDVRVLRKAHESVQAALQAEAERTDATVAEWDQRLSATASRMKQSQQSVDRTLDKFRGGVARILQGGENVRRSLIEAARRITALEHDLEAVGDLGVRLAGAEGETHKTAQRLEEFVSEEQAARGRLDAALHRHVDESEEARKDLQTKHDALAVLLAQHTETLEADQQRLDAVGTQLGQVGDRVDGATTRVDEVVERLAGIDARFGGLTERLDGADTRIGASGDRVDAVGEHVAAVGEHVAAVGEHVAAVDEHARGLSGRLERVETAHDAVEIDALAFAERFRGSEEEIRARLSRYVDLFREAGVPDGRPLLEIGAGRGEFLALCGAAGLTARGVERNRSLVDRCRERGLDVTCADAIEYLADLDDAALGGVFSAQVVEHLRPGELQAMLREAHRALAPGGRIVLETLNPTCLSILATTFYRDPDHRNPIHPDTAMFLLEAAGYSPVEVRTHTPVPDSDRLPLLPPSDHPAVDALRETLNVRIGRLNDLLFGDQEYHVIGVKA